MTVEQWFQARIEAEGFALVMLVMVPPLAFAAYVLYVKATDWWDERRWRSRHGGEDTP